MALTQSAWAKSSDNGRLVLTCSVIATTAENDAYTLPVPKELDTRLPFTVSYYCSNTPDGSALPLDLWIGYGDTFVIAGDATTVAAPCGSKYMQFCDDVVLAVSTATAVTFSFDPKLPVAQVVAVSAILTGYKVRTPNAPRIAFNANGASTLAAVTHYWTIMQ